jgi:prepilin-type N-terminal cleavage/methylation domain-containing protein
MEMSQYSNHAGRGRNAGFSLLEVVIAIFVLTVGLSAMAGLVGQSLNGTESARYMALATTLASEKLEDLNRWTSVDSHVVTGGSLTTDTTVGTLKYYDDIDLSNTNGQVSETIAVGGGYSTVVHMATGEVDPNNNTAPASGIGVVAFHRRWLIEPDPIVNGVTLTGIRRVTVIVSLSNTNIRPVINYQMSMVRP